MPERSVQSFSGLCKRVPPDCPGCRCQSLRVGSSPDRPNFTRMPLPGLLRPLKFHNPNRFRNGSANSIQNCTRNEIPNGSEIGSRSVIRVENFSKSEVENSSLKSAKLAKNLPHENPSHARSVRQFHPQFPGIPAGLVNREFTLIFGQAPPSGIRAKKARTPTRWGISRFRS